MPIVATSGVELQYEVVGRGPPVLLIAGFDLGGWSWFRQLPAFSRRFTTIVLQHRGIDGSVALPRGFGIADMVDDALCVLAHLGIQQTSVLGFSMGGFIAKELSIRRPDVVTRLILVATTAGARTSVRPAPGVLESLMDAYRPGSSDEMRARADQLGFSDACLAEGPAFLREFGDRRARQPGSGNNWLQFAGIAMGYDGGDRLAGVACPCLVVTGSDDPVVPAANAVRLSEMIPGATLLVIPGGRHLCFIEYADEFNRAVMDFLRDG